MEALVQDPRKDAREIERQIKFRQTYVEGTPSWYHGMYHLTAMLVIQVSKIGFWSQS
jgi:hypothetical protein